ncbi:MAG: hypothetical protein E5W53_10700 [Mesorhizobium sp.]|nr:MAG: hypothetical protein E5W53_10700 [Mesorhizobium sp.]
MRHIERRPCREILEQPGVDLGDIFCLLLQPVWFYSHGPVDQQPVVGEIVKVQDRSLGIERIPDPSQRVLPSPRVECAIVDRADQLRQVMMRQCLGHRRPPHVDSASDAESSALSQVLSPLHILASA